MDTYTFTTLKDIYDHSIGKFQDNTAYSVLDGTSLTYREFDATVKKIQEMIFNSGIRPGDKVAIYSRSMPTWPATYFACTTAGIIAVPILPDFTADELSKLLEHSQAKGLFVGSRLRPRVSQQILDNLNLVVLTDDLSVISQNVTEPSADPVQSDPTPEDIAVIIYTSGTTSSPKGVMLSHHALAMQINIYQKFYLINQNDVFLSILPLSHTYECSIGMIYPFAFGSHVVYIDKAPTAAVLMPAFQKVRPTVMISVPLVIEKIYRSAVLGKITRSHTGKSLYRLALGRKILHLIAGSKLKKALGGRMRFLAVGGAKLNSAAERFLLEGDLPYVIGYGLTETAPLLCAFKPGKARLGTTGPVAGDEIQVKIANPAPGSGEGELLVRTPSLMMGYYKNPEATAAVIDEDGWFHTKDIATIDKDGYVSILGRTNFMIVGPSGENIYPEEIENVLNTNNFVAESLVVPRDGKLVGLVVLDSEKVARLFRGIEDKKAAIERLAVKIRDYVNKRVNSFSRIVEVQCRMEPFEKTPTQKIRRNLYL